MLKNSKFKLQHQQQQEQRNNNNIMNPGPNLFNQLKLNESNNFYGTSNILKFQKYLFRERFKIAKNLYKTNLLSHYGCVNAIEFSNCGKYLISGGDDRRVLLWDVEKSIANYDEPIAMDKEHQSNIFCLGFNNQNTRILSGGNDEMVMIHDFETRKVVDVHIHLKPVYGLSINPQNDNKFATACEDGKITIFDQRKSAAVLQFGKFGSRQASFHAIQFHPEDGNYLVTANTRKGAAFWDLRSTTRPVIQYGGEDNQQSCMSVRFSSNGKLVLALRRRLPPILYNTFSETPICQFYHPDYYNSCTMKSCCFAGMDDEYVLSGSDDFNLYMWRVGDIDLDITNQWIENTHLVLYGHRSIVNQVRYNAEKCIIASSGVEKIIKLWSPFEQKNWTGSLIEESACSDNPREVYSHDAYVTLVHTNMSHDYSTQNTEEDSRMMAFFDSLVQQEIEGWNTQTSEDNCTSSSSGAQSSRHNTSDDSDDGLVNYFAHPRDRSRRAILNSTVKPQRNKYANRIAYLIATKRNTLRRLALKGAKNTNRRRYQSLNIKSKRKSHGNISGINQRSQRTTRSSSFNVKRNGRYNSTSTFRQHRSTRAEENSRSKRYETGFRSLRRKHRTCRTFDSSDSSSDNEDSDKKVASESARPNLAIPSTSTGITSSNREAINRLRLQIHPVDSEESDDVNETGPIPTDSSVTKENSMSTSKSKPIRNNTLENNTENSNNNNNHNNKQQQSPKVIKLINRKRRNSNNNNITNTSNNNNNNNLSLIYSSHSNSRLSNSSYLEDDSSESLDCFTIVNKKVKMKCAESDQENSRTVNNTNEQTPDRAAGDSGISLISGSSLTPNSNNNCEDENFTNINNNNNANDSYSIKLFQQKISRIRRNYRKKFSESD